MASQAHHAAIPNASDAQRYAEAIRVAWDRTDPDRARLRAFQRLARRLSGCLDRAEVAEAVFDLGLELVHADEATISALVSADEVEILYAHGDPQPVYRPHERLRLRDWRPGADAVTSRAPVWLESPREIKGRYPELEPFRARWGHSAWVLVPLVMDGCAAGLLGLVYQKPHHFDASERSYIVALADQCVQALHRARLSERLESTLEKLKSAQELTAALCAAATPADVASAVSRAGLVATGATTAYLFWRRDDGLELIQDQSHSHGPGEGPRFVEAGRVGCEARLPVTEAERTGAPVWSDTSAALPLAVNGVTVGVFGLGYAHARSFGPEDRTFLVGIATQCAQALHRAMLFRAEAESRRRAEAAERIAKRTVARLTLAGEIVDALAHVDTEAEVTRVVFEKAAEVFGAVAGMVTRRTADDELEVVHVFGPREREPGPSSRLDGRGPHAEVFRTRRPLWLPDGQDLFSRYPEVERPLLPREGAAWIAVPLSLHGELSGTLSLTISSMPEDDAARASLLRLVDQCGRALSRARLAESERTARRAAQRAEVETRRLGKRLEQFVAMVAHDLRTPLNAIQLTVKALFADSQPTEAQSRRVGRVFASVERIAEILRALCDFSQARLAGGIPLETERVDLGRLVRRAVVEMEAAHPGRTIQASFDGDLAIVGDGGRLLQVLSNLLGNAIQHGSTRRPVTVGVRGEGAAIVIDVHNDGPPISPALLPSLFEPFRQGEASQARAKHTGSMGLGLFIVHEVVHAHGGMVSVDSRPERGTTFTVVVPRFPSHPLAGPGPAPSGEERK